MRAGGMGTGGVAGMMWHLGEEEEPYGAQAITIRGAFSSRDARRRGMIMRMQTPQTPEDVCSA